MADANSSLTYVLERVLRENHADEETERLSVKESKLVYQLVTDYLETDNPWWDSLEPRQIADDIYGSCEGLSVNAAERWLASLTAEELAALQLGDVLMALQPGHYDEYEQQADENEEERRAKGKA
jgi:hypothetical protein